MACVLNNPDKMMEDVEEGEKEEEEDEEEAVATRMKEEMKKMIQERADELKAKRSEVINILVDVTQEFITRVRLVSANDTIPEEVLYNLDRAILICGRLQNDIRIIFGSNLSPLPQAHSASFGCSSQAGGGGYYYPNGLHPANPSPPESLQPDYYEQAAYKEYDQIDPDGKQIGNNQDEEHFYEKLCWPNKPEKRESSSDGTVSHLYNNVVTQTALAAAVDPCFSDYDATGGNVPSITALLPGLNRGADEPRYERMPTSSAAARATHPEENQPLGPTGHGHVSNDTDQTIPNTNEPTIGANDAHQTIPNTLEGTFSTSDVNQTIPKTVEGTFSTSDVDQTIPKTVEGTFSTSDVNQTIRKTVEGTFSTSDVNQTIPKTSPDGEAHPHSSPERFRRDDPKADKHPNFPSKQDQRDNPEADLHPRFPPKHDQKDNPEADLHPRFPPKHDHRRDNPEADLHPRFPPKHDDQRDNPEADLHPRFPPKHDHQRDNPEADLHPRFPPKHDDEQQRIPDIWCQLGVISTTGYPAHVMFHGYKRRTQISTNAIKIYFDDVCSISEKLYDRNEGYFTAPYRGYYRFHLSLKADYPPDLNTEVNSSCTLRIVCGEENGSEDTYTWSDCTVKHSDWTQGGPDKAVSIYPKRYFRKGEHFTVQAIASTGVWFSVENFINLFILQSSS